MKYFCNISTYFSIYFFRDEVRPPKVENLFKKMFNYVVLKLCYYNAFILYMYLKRNFSFQYLWYFTLRLIINKYILKNDLLIYYNIIKCNTNNKLS